MGKLSESADGAPRYLPGQHPNSRANLKSSWRKGQSGNPAGRPSTGPLITPALRRLAGLTPVEFFALDLWHGCTMAEAVAAALLTQALQREGDKARQEVTERLDGKTPDVLALAGADGVPLVLAWPALPKADDGANG